MLLSYYSEKLKMKKALPQRDLNSKSLRLDSKLLPLEPLTLPYCGIEKSSNTKGKTNLFPRKQKTNETFSDFFLVFKWRNEDKFEGKLETAIWIIGGREARSERGGDKQWQSICPINKFLGMKNWIFFDSCLAECFFQLIWQLVQICWNIICLFVIWIKLSLFPLFQANLKIA